jgi:CBS domain-containing protein
MHVKDLMATDVVAIPITATVTEAAEILREAEVSGAPVVDRTGTPIGVISIADLAFGWGHAEAERQRVFYRASTGEYLPFIEDEASKFGECPVRRVMMPLVFSVRKDDPVRKAAALMRTERIHRVIVLDGTRLIGVLSAWDIAAAVGSGELSDGLATA